MSVTTDSDRLLIVGSVSRDRLTDADGHTEEVLGGAGLYAALGAAAAGAAVRVVGLVSDDLPPSAVEALPIDTAGLVRIPGRRLRFQISYDANGQATYEM